MVYSDGISLGGGYISSGATNACCTCTGKLERNLMYAASSFACSYRVVRVNASCPLCVIEYPLYSLLTVRISRQYTTSIFLIRGCSFVSSKPCSHTMIL